VQKTEALERLTTLAHRSNQSAKAPAPKAANVPHPKPLQAAAAVAEAIPKAFGYCWPPLCGGDEVAFGGGPIVLNFAFCSSLSEA
jgi:hypothetical protein